MTAYSICSHYWLLAASIITTDSKYVKQFQVTDVWFIGHLIGIMLVGLVLKLMLGASICGLYKKKLVKVWKWRCFEDCFWKKMKKAVCKPALATPGLSKKIFLYRTIDLIAVYYKGGVLLLVVQMFYIIKISQLGIILGYSLYIVHYNLTIEISTIKKEKL